MKKNVWAYFKLFFKLLKLLIRFKYTFSKIRTLYKTDGLSGWKTAIKTLILRSFNTIDMTNEELYSNFVKKYDTLTRQDIDDIKKHIQELSLQPLISVLMPVYNTNPLYLKKALDSVCNQIYTNWELCIADDSSTNKATLLILRDYSLRDSRIKVTYGTQNKNISYASNQALNLCNGEFTALMDHDDMLPLHSLYKVVVEINNAQNEIDLLYSDEDKIDANDFRFNPYFKTDWNPALILSQNFVAHLGVYRTSILKAINGFKVGYEGSQDYDLVLRFLEKTNPLRIKHIPCILYHWRNFKGHNSFSSQQYHTSDRSAYLALQEYLSRNIKNTGVQLLPMKLFPGSWRVKFSLPAIKPRVSIIIPTRDKIELLQECVSGILENTDYDNIEIIIVDNNSSKDETLNYLESIQNNSKVSVMRNTEAFNYSRLNNLAAKKATGSILAFLNNDIKVIDKDWLNEMVSQLLRDNVGAVGSKLLYENTTIQHAGVILGIYGVACHPFRHQVQNSRNHFGQAQLVRNVSAVTGACLIMQKFIFNQIQGFNEENLKISFNDVDLCLRIKEKGFDIVYTPFAKLYHKESASRGTDDTKEKIMSHRTAAHYMISKYGKLLKEDPFYNLNLSLDNEDCKISMQPRQAVSWRNWIEFVCPFHRGDVLLAIQVCFFAKKKGINLRLHVAESLLEWVLEFNPSFPVEAIPVKIPSALDTMFFMEKAINYVCVRSDFSKRLALSHKFSSFQELGLDIVEHFLSELGLPVDSILDNILPVKKELNLEIIKQYKIENKKFILIHAIGGWDLKRIPEHLIDLIAKIVHENNYALVQIGGKTDSQIVGCDYWILENYNPSEWIGIFQEASAVICVDSWSSHFAAILAVPHLVLYGSTHPDYVSSNMHFKNQNKNSVIIKPVVDCSPCNKLECVKYTLPYCSGFNIPPSVIQEFCNRIKS